MTSILTIKGSTSTQQIEDAIPYTDMRRHAIERRDDAAAVIAEQGDQDVLELHQIDGVDVLYSPTFGYAYVNAQSGGIGDSMVIDNGEAASAEHAALVWQTRNAPEGAIFEFTWRNKFLCTDVESIGGFRDKLAEAVATLDRWMAAGVTLDEFSGIEDDYATFQTTNKEFALAEGFHLAQPDEEDDD
jgi:hypothetical protein